jgi:hypothetical protein
MQPINAVPMLCAARTLQIARCQVRRQPTLTVNW